MANDIPSSSIGFCDAHRSEPTDSANCSLAESDAMECSVVSEPTKEEEYCECESLKIKELYLRFYGNPVDHAGGAINVGQWGKLPKLKGPNIWVPPWLDFRERVKTKERPKSPKAESPSPVVEKKERAVGVRIDAEEQSVVGDCIELCKCGDPCYTHKSSIQEHVGGGVGLSDIVSLSDVMELDSEPHDLKKTKKKESIHVRDIVHNTPLTPIVVLSRLESRVKPDITPTFINLITFIQVAVKAVRVKIERFKHRAKFVCHVKIGYRLAAVNFSGTRRNIETNLNDVVFSVLAYSGCCYQIYLKGEDDVRLVPVDNQGPYIVCFTSLSGAIESLDCGLDVGLIFTIYRRDSKISPYASRTANMSYKYLISSGYALFTYSTKMVISIGKKIISFILDPVAQEFIMNDENIKIPDKGTIISVDEGHSGLWEPQILEYMKRKKDPKLGRPLKTRYVGSLVADFHRILYSGGVYLYPANRKNPQGKTTLLCECMPLAHIVDLAGGGASTGKTDVLKTEADQLGQFIPFFIGSKNEVQELLLTTSSPGRG